MRGEAYLVQSVVSDGALHAGLTDVLCHYFGREARIERLERRISEYCSSFIIEELDVTLDDGTILNLIFKDLSHAALMKGAGKVKPWFFYDPIREIETYRRVLVLHQLGTPICYGAVVCPKEKRYWLFLERVPPVLLWQMGEFQRWEEVARGLAGMHTYLLRETEIPESQHTAHLLRHDREYYWRWMKRAATFVSEGDLTPERKASSAVRWLAERFEDVVERLVGLPMTVIHGEFFASNVMIDETAPRLRVCPVDWEMAAVGPGLVDLAALTAGQWSREQKDAMARAYRDALPDDSPVKGDERQFLENLEYSRLAQAIQLLGWSPFWSPPPEHAQNWLSEAVKSAEILNL